jgi:EAL domain-containing protein (putative c-di-GMP-specific phosphodiesterase class I)
MASAGFSFLLFLSALALFLLSVRASKKLDASFSPVSLTNETNMLSCHDFSVRANEILSKSTDQFYMLNCYINSFNTYCIISGPDCGNELLRTIAGHFKKYGNCDEPWAHCDPDSFLWLFRAPSLTEAYLTVSQIKEELSAIECDKERMVYVSFGLYEIKDASLPIQQMIHFAREAICIIKGDRLQRIAVYDEVIHQKRMKDSELISILEPALVDGEFLAYYQPKYCIKTGCLTGAEALVRWMHPDGTQRAPDHFIPLLEENGLITQLDLYMFETVCQHQRAWLDAGLGPVPVSVNFSRLHLFDPDFCSKLQMSLEKHKVPPSLLEIEFTETTVLEDVSLMQETVEKLHSIGLVVNIDDFGSGYSSLSLLNQISLDVLKLDRSLLINIEHNERAQSIIKAIIHLAHDLALSTVAEGVENEDQLDILRDIGCDVAQGYFFSKPLPQGLYEKTLQEGRNIPQRSYPAPILKFG